MRGLAAVLVVFSHLFNVYPFAPGIVSAIIAAPEVAVPASWLSRAVTQPWINLGPFGVGVFFLVSGFVIPFSLRRHGRAGFLLARALRIYPTYWAALAAGCILVWASARWWGRPLPFNVRSMWANATLLHTWRNIDSIDRVNWTLVIELHFYLFAAILRPWLLRASLLPMLAACAGAAAVWLAQRTGLIGTPSFLELIAMSLPYMLVGTLFHYHFTGALGAAALAGAAAGLLAVFVGLQLISPATGGDPVTIASYAEAFLVFAAAYAARAWLPDWRVLRALARISYPLYAVHLMAGFTLLTFMIAGPPGWPFEWAGGAVLAILLALATALHWGIERHTIRWGAALGRINPRAGTPASHPGAAVPPARPPAASPANPRS